MRNKSAETVKVGVQDAIQQSSIFEKELRDAIEKRKGKAPDVGQKCVEWFVNASRKLHFTPACVQGTKLLDRILGEKLYLLSDRNPEQYDSRLRGDEEAGPGKDAPPEDTDKGWAGATPEVLVDEATTPRLGSNSTAIDRDHAAKKVRHESEAILTSCEKVTALSTAERNQLNRFEKTIAKGRDAMLKACKALKGIRDQRLYREQFDTFEGYCLQKWNLARSSAYQRLTLAQAHETLSATADKPVEVNERQARALGGLNDADMVRVWKQAVNTSNTQNPSTKSIKAARKELKLAPVKSSVGTPSPKPSGDTDQVIAPESSQGEFDPGSRWQTFRDQVNREYEGWPQAHRVAFRDNLRAWLKEQQDGDNETENLASEAA